MNGQPVDIYATATRYSIRNGALVVARKPEVMTAANYDGKLCYYGYLDFVGAVRVEITAAWSDSLRSATIHPLSYGITPQMSGRRFGSRSTGRES